MNLTDQQWHLLKPHFSSDISNCEEPDNLSRKIGRPSIHPRPVLDAILWKLRTCSPWYDLPDCYPSHQTVYRRYCQWRRTRLLHKIFRVLNDDLLQRGDFDVHQVLQDGIITVKPRGNRFRILADVEILDTWQLSTGLAIIQFIITHVMKNSQSCSEV